MMVLIVFYFRFGFCIFFATSSVCVLCLNQRKLFNRSAIKDNKAIYEKKFYDKSLLLSF